jgi:hypothetical protein
MSECKTDHEANDVLPRSAESALVSSTEVVSPELSAARMAGLSTRLSASSDELPARTRWPENVYKSRPRQSLDAANIMGFIEKSNDLPGILQTES